MKSIFWGLIIILILATWSVSAAPDSECQDLGFNYGVAKWTYDGGWILVDENDEVSTLVEGSQQSITWKSSEEITAVAAFELCTYQVLIGGFEGQIASISVNDEILTILFCSDEDYSDDGSGESGEEDDSGDGSEDEELSGEVPEFSTIMAVLVLITAGFYVVKKRK